MHRYAAALQTKTGHDSLVKLHSLLAGGQNRFPLAGDGVKTGAEVVDFGRPEAFPPALFDFGGERRPDFAGLQPVGCRANEFGRRGRDRQVAPAVHAIQIRPGAGAARQFFDADGLVTDELHAVPPHHH